MPRLLQRWALLATLLAVAGATDEFTLAADGSLRCRLGSAASTAAFARVEYKQSAGPPVSDAARWSPWQSIGALRDAGHTGACQPDAACGADSQPLFDTAVSDAVVTFHVWCGCAANFFRRASGGACEPCAATEVCPAYAVQRFACPAPLRVEAGECVGVPGWRPDPNPAVLALGLLLFHDGPGPVAFRLAARVEPCPPRMEPAGAACACVRGYFLPAAGGGAACAACPRGHFCAGGVASPCPAPATTLFEAAGGPDECVAAPTPRAQAQRAPVGHYLDRGGAVAACAAGATTLTAGATHAGACFCRAGRAAQPLPSSRAGFACAVAAHGPPLRVAQAPSTVAALFAGVAPGATWEPPPPTPGELAAHGNSALLAVVLALHGGELALTAHFADAARAHRQAESRRAAPLGLPTQGLLAVALLAAWSPREASYDAVLVLASARGAALWRVDFAFAYDVSAHALRFARAPAAAALFAPAPAHVAAMALAPLRAGAVVLAVVVERERVFAQQLLLVPASDADGNASNTTGPVAATVAAAYNASVPFEAAPRFHTRLSCVAAAGAGSALLFANASAAPPAAPAVVLWGSGLCANISLAGGAGAHAVVRLDSCEALVGNATRACAPHAHADRGPWEEPADVALEDRGRRFRASALAVHLWRARRADFVLAWEARGPLARLVVLHPAPPDRAPPGDPLVACAAGGACAAAGAAVQRAAGGLCAAGYAQAAGAGCAACAPPWNASIGCRLCAPPFFCADGREYACPPGSSARLHGALSLHACVCDAGSYRSAEGPCAPCERGFFCEQGARAACPARATTPAGNATRAGDCACEPGFRARAGGILACEAQACAPPLQRQHDASCGCAAGSYLLPAGGACVACAPDALCPAGALAEGALCPAELLLVANRARARCVCRAGYYSAGGDARGDCQPCPRGFWCDAPRELPLVPCPAGESSAPATPAPAGCFCARGGFLKRRQPGGAHDCVCDAAFYRNHSACEPCPAHSRALAVGAERRGQCECVAGFFAREGPGSECAPCPAGHYCSGGARSACAPGSFGPALRQSSARACLPCRGGSAPAATSAAACAEEVLPLRVRGAFRGYAERQDTTERTWVRVRFASSGAPPVGAARAADLQARFARCTGGRGPLEVIAVDEGVRETTVALQSTAPALGDILALLAGDAAAWAWIAHAAATQRLDTHALLTHAVFCELARAVVLAAFARSGPAAAASPARTECVTAGLVLPGAQARADVQARARLVAAATAAGAPEPGGGEWDMHPQLAEMLRVAAANLHSSPSSRARAWASGEQLRDEAMLFETEAARGVLLLVPANASRFARGPAVFAADYALVFGDLAPAACESAVLWTSGACARVAPLPAQAAPCRFCPGGVAFLRGGECAPCSQGLRCPEAAPGEAPLELLACCAQADSACRAPQLGAAAQTGGGCRNGIHELGEACDPTSRTPLAACCTANCTLRAGYYAEPACMTYCGDGVVAAPAEQCEPGPAAAGCSLLTCRFE